MADESLIKSLIRKFGWLPEHNYFHYCCKHGSIFRNVFVPFGSSAGAMALFRPGRNIWYLVNGILAPKKKRMDVLLKFLDYAFRNSKKVVIEADSDLRREILKNLPKKYRACSPSMSMHWPVYKFAGFDASLNGKSWKKIRNIRNRFYKNRSIKVINSGSIGEKALLEILKQWLKKRPHNDNVNVDYYRNAIKSNFNGFDAAKTVVIDGIPCSISAGWRIPNSNSFYWGIGIHDYSHSDLSVFLNYLDLADAKSSGYEYCELGGSDKSLLYTKMKFKPSYIYKTYMFSILLLTSKTSQ